MIRMEIESDSVTLDVCNLVRKEVDVANSFDTSDQERMDYLRASLPGAVSAHPQLWIYKGGHHCAVMQKRFLSEDARLILVAEGGM